MKFPSILVTLVTCLAFSSVALAVDIFSHQPNVEGAYNKIVAALAQIDKARVETPGEHVKTAIVEFDSAKTFLELATNNKGTYLHTAKELCDQAKAALQATPPDLDKATQIGTHALEEVKRAGLAGRHKH